MKNHIKCMKIKCMLTRKSKNYFLVPVNKSHSGILFTSEFDLPPLAKELGWNKRLSATDRCRHLRTDGTIECPDCGAKPSEFVSAADYYLRHHCGVVRAPIEYFD